MEHTDTLTLPDLAALMRISVRHARRLVRDGDLPAPLRLGRCQRWSRKQVEAWLDATTQAQEQAAQAASYRADSWGKEAAK